MNDMLESLRGHEDTSRPPEALSHPNINDQVPRAGRHVCC
jgi:hypothetical protein